MISLTDSADRKTDLWEDVAPERFLEDLNALKGKKAQQAYTKAVPGSYFRSNYEFFVTNRCQLLRKCAATHSLESAEAFRAALDMIFHLLQRRRNAATVIPLLDSLLLLLTNPKGRKFAKALSYLHRSRIVISAIEAMSGFRIMVPKKFSRLLADEALIASCLLDSGLSQSGANLLIQHVPAKLAEQVRRAVLDRYLLGSSHLYSAVVHVTRNSPPEERVPYVRHALDGIATGNSSLPADELLKYLTEAAANGVEAELSTAFTAALTRTFRSARDAKTKVQCLTLGASHAASAGASGREDTRADFEAMSRSLNVDDATVLMNRLRRLADSDVTSAEGAAYATAYLQRCLAVLRPEELLEAAKAITALLKNLSRKYPDLAFSSIARIEDAKQFQNYCDFYFRSLREQHAETEDDAHVARFSGRLLKAAVHRTQFSVFQWLLDTGEYRAEFWRAVLNEGGFERDWHPIVFEMLRDASEAVRSLKHEFVSQGFAQGQQRTNTFYLEKVKLVLRALNELSEVFPQESGPPAFVNARNDLMGFLSQLKIGTYGQRGERVRFDPQRHDDPDQLLKSGADCVVRGPGYTVATESLETVLMKAPVTKVN